MIVRFPVFIFLIFLASCASDEEKAPADVDKRDIKQKNIDWRNKSDDWLAEKNRRKNQFNAHNKGPIFATKPDIKVNPEQVAKVAKLAKEGDPEYQYSYGMCFKYGYGVQADKNKALYWFKKAADQGHRQAERVYKFMLQRK